MQCLAGNYDFSHVCLEAKNKGPVTSTSLEMGQHQKFMRGEYTDQRKKKMPSMEIRSWEIIFVSVKLLKLIRLPPLISLPIS